MGFSDSLPKMQEEHLDKILSAFADNDMNAASQLKKNIDEMRKKKI